MTTYTAKMSNGKPTLRITSVYGKTSAEAVQGWIDKGYLLYADRKNISRSFPHRLQLPGRTKTANRFLDENDFSEETLGIVSNPVDAGKGLAKLEVPQNFFRWRGVAEARAVLSQIQEKKVAFRV